MRQMVTNKKISALFFAGFLLSLTQSQAQNLYAYSGKKINATANVSVENETEAKSGKQTLFSALKELNKKKDIYFLFSEPSIAETSVDEIKNPRSSVESILDMLLKGTGLNYKKIGDKTYVIVSAKVDDGQKSENANTNNFADYVSFDEIKIKNKQDNITGKVIGADGFPLSGVSIQVKGSRNGTVTNNNGEFSINAKKVTYWLSHT